MRSPRNQWYCAAFGHELQDKPLGRMFLNEPVVMYRRGNGVPVAFDDRCCHRARLAVDPTVKVDAEWLATAPRAVPAKT